MTDLSAASPILLEIDVSKGLARPIDGSLRADEQQKRKLQEALGVQHVQSLQVRYSVDAAGANRYRVSGDLQAQITQSCVVSFEPVEETVEADFDVTFWPQDMVQEWLASNAENFDGLQEEPEPYSGETLDLGQFFYEVLATAIDPYPRKPGAELQLSQIAEGAAEEVADTHPFAALKDYKK